MKVEKKSVLKYLCWFIIVLAVMYALKGQFSGSIQDEYNNPEAELTEVDMDGKVIEQHFSISGKPVTLNFLLQSTGEGTESLIFTLCNVNGKKIYEKEMVITGSLGEEQAFIWDVSQVDFQGETELVLKITGGQGADQIAMCVQSDDTEQSYFENGEAKDLHLRMSVVYGFVRYYGFFALFGFTLFTMGAACIFAWEHKMQIEKLFVVIALAAGMGIAFINPLAQEPDGFTHFMRTIDVSYGNVFAPIYNNAHPDGHKRQPVNLEEIQLRVIKPNLQAGLNYTKNIMNIKFSKETVLVLGECGYTSLFYMPQAIGTLIGRTLNLSIYSCMVMGRMCNLLCYIILTYWALKKIPFYKTLLFVIALLPMTIYQAASYSPDSMLNGLCFLFAALCFYYAFGEKENLNWKHAIGLGGMLALMFMCKYVYVCMGLLVFMIPKSKFENKKNYWKSFAIALIPIFIIVMLYARNINIEPAGQVQEMTESTNSEILIEKEMTQFEYVKENPVKFAKSIIITIIAMFGTYVNGLNTLGWLNYPLNLLQPIIPCVLVTIACLDTQGIKGKVKKSHKILWFATGAVVILMGMIGLYLMDTTNNPVGAELILGYQIRYAIPCFILLFPVFSSDKIQNNIDNFYIKAAGAMSLFLSYTIFTLVRICY